MKVRDLFLYEMPADQGGGAPPVPGTGTTDSGQPDPPSAATQITETQDAPQGPIPYARFKEVNDSRRDLEQRIQPFADLESYGYGADDLQRLVSWEQEYLRDPVGTWLNQASQIEDLPPEVKAAIENSVSAGTQGGASDTPPPQQAVDDQQTDDGEPPEWAQPLLQDHAARQAQIEQEAISGFYDGIVKAWDDMDAAQGIRTTDAMKHAFIASASVNAQTPQELLQFARETYLSSRAELLGEVVRPPGLGGQTVPRAVPGSGGGPAGQAPAPKPRTLREASRMAEADYAAGQLAPQQR